MNELSREQYIKANYGSTHRVDIRATIGRLTMPSPDQTLNPVRPHDVKLALEAGGVVLNDNMITHELGIMERSGWVELVDVPYRKKERGTYYGRVQSEGAAAGWRVVEAAALAVLIEYPDAIQNRAWQELIIVSPIASMQFSAAEWAKRS